MAGLGAVLMLYLVLISLGLASWGKLVEGFDPDDPEGIIRIACEVRRCPFFLLESAESSGRRNRCSVHSLLVARYRRIVLNNVRSAMQQWSTRPYLTCGVVTRQH